MSEREGPGNEEGRSFTRLVTSAPREKKVRTQKVETKEKFKRREGAVSPELGRERQEQKSNLAAARCRPLLQGESVERDLQTRCPRDKGSLAPILRQVLEDLHRGKNHRVWPLRQFRSFNWDMRKCAEGKRLSNTGTGLVRSSSQKRLVCRKYRQIRISQL